MQNMFPVQGLVGPLDSVQIKKNFEGGHYTLTLRGVTSDMLVVLHDLRDADIQLLRDALARISLQTKTRSKTCHEGDRVSLTK